MKPPVVKRSRTTDPGDQVGLERLVFFSDAVFAIAITLLALNIRLPVGEKTLNDSNLAAQLVGSWHSYLGYFISFMMVGAFWTAHHRKFRFIKRYDSILILLNLFFLMMIGFIPFPSSIISEYSNRTATIFYALPMLLAGLFLGALWWYASWKGRLIDASMDLKQRQRQFIAPLLMATVFLVSIGIAFINADAAKFLWLLNLFIPQYAKKTY
jgi:uncharacterized membrane protein